LPVRVEDRGIDGGLGGKRWVVRELER